MLPKTQQGNKGEYHAINQAIVAYHNIFDNRSSNEEFKNKDLGPNNEYIEIIAGPELPFSIEYKREKGTREEFLTLKSGRYTVTLSLYTKENASDFMEKSGITIEDEHGVLEIPNIESCFQEYMQLIQRAVNEEHPLGQLPPFEPTSTQY